MPARPSWRALPLLILIAACDRASELPSARPAPEPLAALTCRGDATTRTLRCESIPPSGAARTLLTVGGQDRYVRLASSGTNYNSDTDILSSIVTVQDLLLAPLATADGTTPDPAGVRVFFATGPSDGVTVLADGTGAFTAADQPYYAYAGADLGADGVLSPEEVSAGRTWSFDMNGASSFTFTVYVQAEVPDGAPFAAHFTRITAGAAHSCALDAGGVAYCWGSDLFAQLGNGTADSTDRGVPSRVDMPPGITFSRIRAGASQSCAEGSDQQIYCWGYDEPSQIGPPPDPPNKPSPLPVVAPAGVTLDRVSVGSLVFCAIGSGPLKNGQGYCWGDELYGELGDGHHDAIYYSGPREVHMPAGVSFASIDNGVRHTCAVATDGRAFCWGQGPNGELGDGATTAQVDTPVAVLLPAGVTLASIDAGYDHTCGVTTDQKVYCWGSDLAGQLGNGPALTAAQLTPMPVTMPAGVGFTAVTVGSLHSCALGTDARIYCWGAGTSGELGTGTLSDSQPAPVEVPLPAGVAFTAVSAFDHHTCATTAGASYCWGSNGSRRLGDGTTIARPVPTAVAATN